MNQLSIIYGLARGVVAAATGTTTAGPYLLPSVNFFEIVSRKVQRLMQQREHQAKTVAALEELHEPDKELV